MGNKNGRTNTAEAKEDQFDPTSLSHLQLQQHLKAACRALIPASRRLEEAERSLIEVLLKINWDVALAKIVGSSVSLGVGFPLMVGGIAAAPFTLGTSTILTIVGGAISVAGGATASGAQIVQLVKGKQLIKEIEALREDFYDKQLDVIRWQLALKTDKRGIERETEHLAKEFDSLLFRSAGASAARIGLCFTDDAVVIAKLGITSSAAIGRLACKGALAGLSAAFDIYTIVEASRDIRLNRNAVIDLLKKEANAINQDQGIAEAYLLKDVSAKKFQAIADALRCVICHEVSSSPVKCKECLQVVGCRSCVDEWLQQRHNCPLCRAEWPSAQVETDQLAEGLNNLLIGL